MQAEAARNRRHGLDDKAGKSPISCESPEAPQRGKSAAQVKKEAEERRAQREAELFEAAKANLAQARANAEHHKAMIAEQMGRPVPVSPGPPKSEQPPLPVSDEPSPARAVAVAKEEQRAKREAEMAAAARQSLIEARAVAAKKRTEIADQVSVKRVLSVFSRLD